MEKKEKRTFKQFFMDNNKRNLKITITVVCVVLALAIIGGGIYIGNKLGLITIDHGSNGDPEGTFAPEEQFDAMYDVSDASSIDSLITAWAKNGGAKYSSKNIINVLLLGVDSETGKAEGGRSDAIILLSLNKKTKTITLVSFLRDCYTYMNINGSERCCKTNHAYFWGGPAALIETLENNYKIEIDHYISVDFKSFPKLIDSLGGVSVPIEPYEADYINRTTTKIKKITSGDSVKLSGRQESSRTNKRESKTPFVCSALFLLFGKQSDQEVFMLDVAIIGCGVIGAASAYELSHYPLQTAVFEAENDVADCTTKANSAILHAG